MLNSNEQFRIYDTFSLNIYHIRDPVEEQATRESESFEKNVRTQNSVIKIKNVDELCCARAIVTMKAYCDFGRHTQYYNLQRATC